MSSKESKTMRNRDVEEEWFLAIAHFLVGIQDTKGNYRLTRLALVEALHCSQFHGLMLGNGNCRCVATDAGEYNTNETNPTTNLEAANAVVTIAALKQHPSTDADHKSTTQSPCTCHSVEHLAHCHWRQCYSPKVGHLVAHCFRVECASHRILHPGVSDKNPQGRDTGT